MTRASCPAGACVIPARRVAGVWIIAMSFALNSSSDGNSARVLTPATSRTVVPMVPACDYKKIGDNDQGLNTGGIGGYGPPGFFPAELADRATNAILLPAVKAMADEGIPYKGVLYAGLMLTDREILTLEFNARFGDPESQVTLPLLKTDLVDILMAVIEGNLDQLTIDQLIEIRSTTDRLLSEKEHLK